MVAVFRRPGDLRIAVRHDASAGADRLAALDQPAHRLPALILPARRRLIGKVVQLRALYLEVPALVADVLAGEKLPDDLDGFLQAFVADPRSRPAAPGDVLVEVLSGAEAEGEPAAGQHADGGRLLRHQRWVVAERRALTGRFLRPARWLLLFVATSVIRGSSFLFIRTAVEHMPPSTVLVGRTVLGAAFLVPLTVRRRAFRVVRRVIMPVIAVTLLDMARARFLTAWGEQHVSSSVAIGGTLRLRSRSPGSAQRREHQDMGKQ